jgi:hypothetical protein
MFCGAGAESALEVFRFVDSDRVTVLQRADGPFTTAIRTPGIRGYRIEIRTRVE